MKHPLIADYLYFICMHYLYVLFVYIICIAYLPSLVSLRRKDSSKYKQKFLYSCLAYVLDRTTHYTVASASSASAFRDLTDIA